jgi:N-methylhydantoinase B
VSGGKAGANSRFIKNPDSQAPEELRNSDLVNCAPGDVIRLQGPAGGGYGHPYDRPVEKVLEDVRCGFVSPRRARDAYGVAMREDLTVDMEATKELRAGDRGCHGHFDYGPGRSRFESIWTKARYDAMTRIMAAIPVSWRHFVKHQMFAALAGTPPPQDGGAPDIDAIYAQLSERYADLPTPASIAGHATARS